jgi:NarL family two-component system response regulator LiaR
MTGPIRVLLVDDESIFLHALRALLDHDERVEVVGEAGNAVQALRVAAEVHPDVVLIDLALPGMDGFETTRRLIADSPTLKVIAVSGLSNDEAEEAARAAGATTFLYKGGLHDEIADAIVEAAA